ncbi:MAG: hypothetical protein Tsb0019_11880 [Roseibium sp.]
MIQFPGVPACGKSLRRSTRNGKSFKDKQVRKSPEQMEQAHTAPYPGNTDQRSSARESPSPERSQVQSALAAALQSREFQSAPQLRSFLGFIVGAALNDEQEKLKGYTIAVEALGRPQDFNPVTDPIVRVEAARLRRRLAKYYAGSGAADPVRIDIPKGSYAPEFKIADASEPRTPLRTGQCQKTAVPCEGDAPGPVPMAATAMPVPTGPATSASPVGGNERAKTAPERLADRRVPLTVTLAVGLLGFLMGYMLASS